MGGGRGPSIMPRDKQTPARMPGSIAIMQRASSGGNMTSSSHKSNTSSGTGMATCMYVHVHVCSCCTCIIRTVHVHVCTCGQWNCTYMYVQYMQRTTQ